MSTVKIDITADDQDTANAVTAAVQLGLSESGFTSVDVAIVDGNAVAEPESLLASLQLSNPAVFGARIEIDQSVVLPTDEEADDATEGAPAEEEFNAEEEAEAA